ncbi:cytochrome c oxidase subunit IVB [Heyndrickxia sporothermodurans]|uniref:Cytochrome c oxidase subunit IVB n=1 Tax=Heyndrickxia sporothermodurans TaxID=46224 RepID=A0A150KY92_9BACI|nr:cytochrome c oxidase subunit IVB [Heyndrickxia sporothermodurans]KYD04382.1 Cytochrome c oxidase, subunit IV [Heyndrickxia sporothermodurans]MBL5768488.1 cytochrome c oxidase subunit IVB [Heyndrickxia sporothermodurans]MBL5772155.1 cytochrome c oxidase subunit IVB [Heyndrickxia sporothermodurans]MBL5775706.1 cytochrome c oxidase subunit IVB [Heyndrickxia sporothermodurans]MBL5779288.1 cytochrome c oxidase subunit IVB [Heyndrickxia sporothermodurans]
MTNEQTNTGNPRVDYEYRRRKSAEEMKYQVVSFVLMILLTLIAFGAVAADLSKWFTIPVILLMAVVQVIFQLYYFMHMSHKGHEAPQLFLFSGAFVGFLTLLTFFTIIWW